MFILENILLVNQINCLKNRLDDLIVQKQFDLSDPEIISISQKLDKILNTYMINLGKSQFNYN